MNTYIAHAYNTTGYKAAECIFTMSQELPYLTGDFLKRCVAMAVGYVDIDHSDIKINVCRGNSDQHVITIFLRSWQDGSSVYCDVYYERYFNVYHVRTIILAE